MTVGAASPDPKMRDASDPPASRIDRFALVIGTMEGQALELHDRLAAHPELARCRTRESNFFGSDRQWSRGSSYYRGLWPDYDPDRHAWALEISTNYAKRPWHPETAARIETFARKTAARFKLIYIVCDPVDRTEAHIAHNLAEGRITTRTYTRHIEQVLDVLRYAYQLEPFADRLDPSDILVLDGDAFAADPADALRDCTRFLGIDSERFPPARPAPSPPPAEASRFRFDAQERRRLGAALRDDALRFRDRWGFDISGWDLPEADGKSVGGVRDGMALTPPAAIPADRASVDPPAPQGAPIVSGYWKRRKRMMYEQDVLAIARLRPGPGA